MNLCENCHGFQIFVDIRTTARNKYSSVLKIEILIDWKAYKILDQLFLD